MRIMKILITNDDGIESPGLLAVVEALRDKANCLVVAPHAERSAVGHSITLYGDIMVEKVDLGGGLAGYSVEGTPADCVKFAFSELSKESKIDLIISGINPGINSGISVYYSGTVSAAREGLINEIPSFAVSQAREQSNQFVYAVNLILNLVEGYRNGALPRDAFLNVNLPPVPAAQIRGIKVTKQAHSRFVERFEPRPVSGGNGKRPYFILSNLSVLDSDGTSDEEVLREGYVSITPLQLDTTHYDRMSPIESWLNRT